jgi:hypothetical protein
VEDLTLGGSTPVSRHFFSDLFTPESPLKEICVEELFVLVASDLINAFQTRPTGLERLELNFVEILEESDPLDFEWDNDCDPDDMREIIDLYEGAGIEVSGTAVDAIEELDGYEDWLENRDTDDEDFDSEYGSDRSDESY